MPSKKIQNRDRRLFGFKVGAIILGLLIGLFVFELGLFIIPPKHQMDNPWYFAAGGGVAPSNDLPFKRPPYLTWQGLSRGDLALMNDDKDPDARFITFRTDKDGFRNNSDIDRASLIFIGDSYTEAGNVPENETFASLVGQRLQIQTRNLGRAGYTPSTELIVLEKYGLTCQPKIVVWQIAEANDLSEEIDYRQWLGAGRPPFFDFEKEGQVSRFAGWKRRSILYKAILYFRPTGSKAWPFSGVFFDDQRNPHQIRFAPIANKNLIAYGHRGWPFLEQAIKAGKSLCEQRNVRLIVLLIPTKFSVMRDHVMLSENAERFFAGFSKIRPEHLMAPQLKELCEKLGIPFIDATPFLQRATASGRLVHFPFDTHPNEQGHLIIADLIVQSLKSGKDVERIPNNIR